MHVILATVGTDGDVFPHLGLGAALRARGHRATLAAPEPYRARADALGLDFGPYLNRARAGLGLPPVRRVFRWWLSPDLVIGLFPGWYAAPQPDWPPQLRLAGFGRFDGARGELPDDVRRFCGEGPPPVAFTLGTGMRQAAGFFRAAVKVCTALGAQGLLLTKYPEVLPARLPTGVRHCA